MSEDKAENRNGARARACSSGESEENILSTPGLHHTRWDRIMLLCRLGRQILSENRDAQLEKLLVGKSLQLWEVQERTAIDYAKRAIYRIVQENVENNSKQSESEEMKNEESPDGGEPRT